MARPSWGSMAQARPAGPAIRRKHAEQTNEPHHDPCRRRFRCGGPSGFWRRRQSNSTRARPSLSMSASRPAAATTRTPGSLRNISENTSRQSDRGGQEYARRWRPGDDQLRRQCHGQGRAAYRGAAARHSPRAAARRRLPREIRSSQAELDRRANADTSVAVVTKRSG